MGDALVAGIRSGWLAPAVDPHVYTLERAAAAHEDIMKPAHGHHGKIVLTVAEK